MTISTVLTTNIQCNQYYQVKNGDNLNKIAADYQTTVEYLVEINTEINILTNLYAGQIMCVK